MAIGANSFPDTDLGFEHVEADADELMHEFFTLDTNGELVRFIPRRLLSPFYGSPTLTQININAISPSSDVGTPSTSTGDQGPSSVGTSTQQQLLEEGDVERPCISLSETMNELHDLEQDIFGPDDLTHHTLTDLSEESVRLLSFSMRIICVCSFDSG